MIRMNNILVRYLLALVIIGSFCLTGCTVRIADLTLVSTKNIDYNDLRVQVKDGKRYRGSDCVVAILGIPFGIPNLKDAVDDALEQGKGNLMVDEVTYDKFVYFILGSVRCIEVEGTVLNARESVAQKESSVVIKQKPVVQ